MISHLVTCGSTMTPNFIRHSPLEPARDVCIRIFVWRQYSSAWLKSHSLIPEINKFLTLESAQLSQKSFKAASQHTRILRFAFPYHADGPSRFFQCRQRKRVALFIPRQFWLPILKVRFGRSCVFASGSRVLVPEAAMHKNHFAPERKNQIRFARKVFPMQTVAVAHCVRQPPDSHFRL